MKENLLGIDVGGTKCAIIYGIKENDELHIIDKKKFDTTTVDETIDRILCETEKMMNLHQLTPTNTKAIGICCGGPLNSETGIVMSPPNLPGKGKKEGKITSIQKVSDSHYLFHPYFFIHLQRSLPQKTSGWRGRDVYIEKTFTSVCHLCSKLRKL